MIRKSRRFLSLGLFLLLLVSINLTIAKNPPGSGSHKGGPVLRATAVVKGDKWKGRVEFTEAAGTTQVIVHFYGLPSGDHPYHVHELNIDFGKCDSAGDHYNPTKKTVEGCVFKRPDTCQIGDLSGKWGKLRGGTSEVRISYNDPSLKIKDILRRSVVVHEPKGPGRIACGTIEAQK